MMNYFLTGELSRDSSLSAIERSGLSNTRSVKAELTREMIRSEFLRSQSGSYSGSVSQLAFVVSVSVGEWSGRASS